jgi:hypothetical protein
MAVLHEPRFVDVAPPQVYASLLDERRSLCSLRTMYRILAANQEVRERGNHLSVQESRRDVCRLQMAGETTSLERTSSAKRVASPAARCASMQDMREK